MKPFLLAGLLLALLPAVRGETTLLDIKSQANTPLEDDGIANNGQGGWTDEGINDMAVYPPIPSGKVERNGYEFDLIDPKANGGNSVIMLRGAARGKDKPESVEIPIGGKVAPFIYFLQTAAGAPEKAAKNYQVATYEVVYKDGTREAIPIRDEIEIRQWFAGAWWDNSGAASWPIFMGTNVYSVKWKKLIGVWAMQWKNPSPEKPIEKIVLRSAGTAVPAIFAVTLSDKDFRADEAKTKEHFARVESAPDGYFDAKLKLERARVFEAAEKLGHFKGIRSVYPIRPDLLAVTVDGAMGESGPGLNNDAMSALQKPEAFSLKCGGGKVFQPEKVGRQSVELWKGNVASFPEVVLYSHTFYLKLPQPLKPGETCTVSVPAIPERFTRKMEVACSPDKTITPAIKVNQVAYSALANERYAYLGWWAGDLGTVDFSDMKKFEVVDEATGKPVLAGDILPRAAADPTSGENVSEMKIEQLPPGKYHIRIPGFARSDTFGVGLANGIKDLYYHTMRAFFHQRSGTELKRENTEFPRPITHRATYESGFGVDNPNYLPKPGEKSKEFSGGYFDAGDDDTFTYHLRAAGQSLLIYEAFPDVFKDKDLNLPESGNKIPDVLDEALWGLSFYQDNQRPDGAIYLGQGNDQDYIREVQGKKGKRPAFGLLDPRNNSATEYAAVAAQVARLLRPFDAARADKLAASAKSAYAWAKANPDQGLTPDEEKRSGNKLMEAYAAAELFNTTGDASYNQDFTALYKDGALKAHWSFGWLPNLVRWAYVKSKQPGVDETIRKDMIKSIKDNAEGDAKTTRDAPYRNGTRVGVANGWGTFNGGGHQAFSSILAYLLTKDPKYLTTASLNADFQLGGNPLSKGFITGLGARHPIQPQLNPLLYSGPEKTGKTAPGITIYGLAGQPKEGGINNVKWYPSSKIPPGRHWVDQGSGSEASSEFTITETIGSSAMLYEFLYALEKEQQK
ncbi:MAG: glycoside hydrolase family 9 protein [Verrucomicrobiae bacterium]